jgi:hypothetical protein
LTEFFSVSEVLVVFLAEAFLTSFFSEALASGTSFTVDFAVVFFAVVFVPFLAVVF